jgi:hypothetical protein
MPARPAARVVPSTAAFDDLGRNLTSSSAGLFDAGDHRRVLDLSVEQARACSLPPKVTHVSTP